MLNDYLSECNRPEPPRLAVLVKDELDLLDGACHAKHLSDLLFFHRIGEVTHENAAADGPLANRL